MIQRVLQIFGFYKWKCRNQSILNHVQRQITNKLNLGSNNVINITTDYLDHNGIYYPSTQGRYLLSAQINNNTNT